MGEEGEGSEFPPKKGETKGSSDFPMKKLVRQPDFPHSQQPQPPVKTKKTHEQMIAARAVKPKSPKSKPRSSAEPKDGTSKRQRQCNCGQSQCLKLNCECFASGTYCDGCNCVNCYNKVENETARREAVETTLERNPNAFRPKIASCPHGTRGNQEENREAMVLEKNKKGCHCKKYGLNCINCYNNVKNEAARRANAAITGDIGSSGQASPSVSKKRKGKEHLFRPTVKDSSFHRLGHSPQAVHMRPSAPSSSLSSNPGARAAGTAALGYRRMSGLSHTSKNVVRGMSSAQAKPCAILAAIQEKNPEGMSSAQAKPCAILAAVQEKNPEENSTSRHAYNYKDYSKRVGSEGRDVVVRFFREAAVYKYVHWELTDPGTKVLSHMFMAHPESVNLFKTYHWFIGMYSTYETNCYDMPLFKIVGMTPCNEKFMIAYAIMKDETVSSFRWVLERLRLLIGSDLHPTTIVTHQKLGLMKLVREFFPQSAHLLCTWHINKDIEKSVYKICGKDKGIAERFKNGKWKKIMEAQTEAEYEKAVRRMKDGMKDFPQVVSYVEGKWLVHKEMFIAAWTNNVLHFGNTTSCRVESEQQWLYSITDALDTSWIKINKEIKSQLSLIRYKLQESIGNSELYNGFPFDRLTSHVSLYCLCLLTEELERMRELSDEVNDRCGCVLRTTHQIPCACELRTLIDSEMPINVERLHPYWRTLVISGQTDFVETDDKSMHVQYLLSLFDEVNANHPELKSEIGLGIKDILRKHS